jgi:hypothetical protein
MSARRKLEELAQKIDGDGKLILICGPGRDHPGFEKRKQIKESLRRAFSKADVFMPEDRQFQEYTARYFEGDIVRVGLAQGVAADLVIALEVAGAEGVVQEVAIFSQYDDLRAKLMVLSPKQGKKKSAYSGAVRSPLHQEFYSEREYSDCHLAKERVVKLARTFLLRIKDQL